MDFNKKLLHLEKEIHELQKINNHFEVQENWEKSFLRKFLLTFLAYAFFLIIFLVTKTDKSFLKALIPTLVFVVPLLGLPLIAKWWVIRYQKKYGK